MAVAVLVLDLPVLAMDHQLAALVLCDVPGPIYGVLLAVENLGIALDSGTPDGPAILTRYYVLIALGHK